MADYVVKVHIGVEPEYKDVDASQLGYTARVKQYLNAAGTYVELESVGELRFDAAERQKYADRDVIEEAYWWEPTWGPEEWHSIESLPDATGSWTLPQSGRPVVFLAVGGGNQVFHHWEGACEGQGARCEVPEPTGDLDAYVIDLYAKAVFAREPDPRLETVQESLANPRVRGLRHPRTSFQDGEEPTN